jgi:hypothetical protein
MSKKRVVACAATVAVVLTGLGSAVAAPAFAGDRPPEPRGYPATADLNGREAPALDATYIHNFVNKGDSVRVVCQTIGGPAYGSRIWDLVSPGAGDPTARGHLKFVPDRFIRTGTDGFSDEIPRCTETEIELAKD